MIVSSKQIVKNLQAFKRLPKVHSVKVKSSKPYFHGHTSNYGLVKVTSANKSVIVPYEVFRKFMELLPGQDVDVSIKSSGLHISYQGGKVFMKHVKGDWKDVAELTLGA